MLSADQNFRFTSSLIDGLTGQLKLLQTNAERIDIVKQQLDYLLAQSGFTEESKLLNSSDTKRKFIEYILSYDICTELLQDENIEDIIINNLKSIHVHHAKKGFLKTELKFTKQSEIDLFVKKLVLFQAKRK